MKYINNWIKFYIKYYKMKNISQLIRCSRTNFLWIFLVNLLIVLCVSQTPNTTICNLTSGSNCTSLDCPKGLGINLLEINVAGNQSCLITGNFSSSVTINGFSLSVSNLNVAQNLIIQYQNYIQITSHLTIGNYLIVDTSNSSNTFIPNQNNNNLSLYIYNANIASKYMIFQTYGNILIQQNSSLATLGNECLYHSIILANYCNLLWQGKYLNLTQLLSEGITMGFISLSSINFTSANFQTSIFSLFSYQNVGIIEGHIDTTAKSCRTNMGTGRGLIVQIKNDFCSSGSSGAGYGLISNTQNQNCPSLLEYFMFLMHSFPYMVQSKIISSGSGGYGYNNFRNIENGAGGGIIYIFAKQTLYVYKSNLEAAGGNVIQTDPLSAGSGGTVYLYSNYLTGNLTNASVYGGASLNQKGGGSGGMVKISYQKLQYPHRDLIYINVSQGFQTNSTNSLLSSNGLYEGTFCSSGRVRWYLGCQYCPPGTYNIIANQYCQACPISNDFSLNQNQIGIQTPQGCFMDDNISQLYYWVVPGFVTLISIGCYIGLLIIFVIIGVLIRRKIKKIRIKNQDMEKDFQSLKKDLNQEKILTQKLKSTKTIELYELMYHKHRITVTGSNTYSCPWILPLIPPEVIKKYVLVEAYQNFAKKFNKIARWTSFQIILSKILYAIYPIHWFYYDTVKKRKYRKLSKLLQDSKAYNLINNFEFQDKDLITLKFSKNKDYTSCYIDFFFYEKADLSYYELKIPFIIFLSGQGNFLRPFYIQQNDPFVKAMNFIVNRNTYSNNQKEHIGKQFSHILDYSFQNDKQKLLKNLLNLNKRKKNQNQLKKFITNFNAISCTLDLSAPIKIFVRTLSILIKYISAWNKKFFNKVKVQVDLILMISDLHQQNIISSSIHILSNKNQQFLSKVQSIIPRMNLNNQVDLKIGLFIYNPEQEIEKQVRRQSIFFDSIRNLQDTMIIKELGQSQSDYQPNEISQHLLEEENVQNFNLQLKKENIKNSSLNAKITRYLCLFRYFMLSHQLTTKDRYIIKLAQSYIILTQTVLVFMWSLKIQLPYIFVNLVAPFIGIIWMISDSYGFGKLFLILNAMNLLNEIASLIIYTVIKQSSINQQIQVIICQSINIILVILNMIVGSRALMYSKKLRNVQ